MTDVEIRLKCLEFAMEQARRESAAHDRQAIAEITTVFYNLTQGTGTPSSAGQATNFNGGKGPKHRG